MKQPHDPRDPAAVDDLLAALDLEHPDPVDVFEDELARRLGCVRGPGCSYEDWRGQRVRKSGDRRLISFRVCARPSAV